MKKLLSLFILGLFVILTPLFGNAASHSTLSKAVGQMLVVGFLGAQVDDRSQIVKAIKKYHIGGVILFNQNLLTTPPSVRNIVSPPQLKTLTMKLQYFAKQYGCPPLFISVDQEGGLINRLTKAQGFRLGKNLSQQALGKLNNLNLIEQEAYERGRLLKRMGINLDYAPVVGLNINPKNPAIGALQRSYSANPKIVINDAAAAIKGYHRAGIFCSLKHFPGLGSASANTDFNRVDVTKTWRPEELLPYKNLIQAHKACDFVMVTSLINRQIAPSGLPALMSKKVVTGILRNKLHFKGIIISDDMDARALRNYYPLKVTLEKSILAGVNVFIFGANQKTTPQQDVSQAYEIIYCLAKQNKLIRQKVMDSYQRIMKIKKNIAK